MDFLLPFIGAALFRLRGWSGIGSTTLGRLIWATGMAVAVIASTPLPLELSLLLPIAFFAGTPWGTFGAIDLATNEGRGDKDMALNALRGLVFSAPVGLLAVAFGYDTGWGIAISGATSVCWYTIGHFGPWPRYATIIGECGTGATIGLALALGM